MDSSFGKSYTVHEIGATPDGYASSVQEALLLGRHVVWTYPFAGALPANNYESLHKHVKRMLELHQQGKLGINFEGREYIKQNLPPELLVTQLQKKIREIIAKE